MQSGAARVVRACRSGFPDGRGFRAMRTATAATAAELHAKQAPGRRCFSSSWPPRYLMNSSRAATASNVVLGRTTRASVWSPTLFGTTAVRSTTTACGVGGGVGGLRHLAAVQAACRKKTAGIQQRRDLSNGGGLMKAAPMVYISGEEMTKYCCDLMMAKWVSPFIDTSAWQYFDLSCKSRDDTEDQVLHDAVAAGADIGAIFKEPTITPTVVQQEQLGLKKAWGSPNGAMRRGWNGITISRDTIHIEGMDLGFKRPVLFERHAVGGEYGAGWGECGPGRLVCKFYPNRETAKEVFEDQKWIKNIDLTDDNNVAVVYHNPLDNVADLAHHFFQRCLDANVVPYVVTKKTVFKWQEGFWQIMKEVFDRDYKKKFLAAGLLEQTNNELQHLISDAATMQIIRWTSGGFGMAAHNYDGDMLTDEVAQVHRSPGFITSNLIGKKEDGTMIKEFEASHGTVADLWSLHLAGKETSLNPLGLAEALIGAMNHAADLAMDDPSNTLFSKSDRDEIHAFTSKLRAEIHRCMATGRGTRDLCGATGLTTEQFIDEVAAAVRGETGAFELKQEESSKRGTSSKQCEQANLKNYDSDKMLGMFSEYDTDQNGKIDFEEFSRMLVKLGVAPKKEDIKL